MIPFGSFKVGSISGIDIEINYTWFIIFALVAAALAFAYFPTIYPQLSVTINVINGILTALLFFGSVLFHELMHSAVALRNGLNISRITLFIFGGVSQMQEEPPTAGIEFRMALAGPMSSFFLAAVFGALYFALFQAGTSAAFFAPFGWLALINGLLAVFNLVPGFPLDGGRVFRSILWYFTNNLQQATKIASRVGQAFAYGLIILGLVMIFRGLLDGLWLILIGWFLNNAARGSYQQLLLRTQLGDVKVDQIMTKDVQTVRPEVNLRDLVDDYFMKYKYGRFPVIDEQGALKGVVTLNDVREVSQNRWNETAVADVIQEVSGESIINPNEEAVVALTQMADKDAAHLMVVENGRLTGIVTRKDIVRLLKVRRGLEPRPSERPAA